MFHYRSYVNRMFICFEGIYRKLFMLMCRQYKEWEQRRRRHRKGNIMIALLVLTVLREGLVGFIEQVI